MLAPMGLDPAGSSCRRWHRWCRGNEEDGRVQAPGHHVRKGGAGQTDPIPRRRVARSKVPALVQRLWPKCHSVSELPDGRRDDVAAPAWIGSYAVQVWQPTRGSSRSSQRFAAHPTGDGAEPENLAGLPGAKRRIECASTCWPLWPWLGRRR